MHGNFSFPGECAGPDVSLVSWTPFRLALLLRLRLSGVPAREALGPLNALPGRRLTVNQVHIRCSREGLTGSCERYLGVETHGVATRIEPPSVSTRRLSVLRWTPARTQILERDYPAGVALQAIADRINALPGDPVTRTIVRDRARVIGLLHGSDLDTEARPAGVNSWGVKQALASIGGADPSLLMHLPIATRPAGVTGCIECSFSEIRAYAANWRLRFDGTNLDAVNEVRRHLGLPPLAWFARLDRMVARQ